MAQYLSYNADSESIIMNKLGHSKISKTDTSAYNAPKAVKAKGMDGMDIHTPKPPQSSLLINP